MSAEGEQGAPGADSGGAPALRVIAERYEVRDRIGRGAFGEVFEVYDRRLSRLVALKTMPIGLAADAEAAEDLRRFYLEAQSVARLSHPGIVTVHDFGEAKEFAWIAMELVIGETLKAVLDRGERTDVEETVRVICALLDALHYAHGRGIVHRDVKPANILLALSAEEGLGEVRLADFGIARIGDTNQTNVGQMMGTPATMSPEQLRGDPVDLRADLWSVGVILYEMLTGKRPFPGGMPAIFHNILTLQPPPPSELVPGLPAGFDTVIATVLAKAPADRYPDAAAMAAAIRAAATGATVSLPPLPGLEPKPAGRDDATVALPFPAAVPAGPAPSRSGGAWRLLLAFLLGLLCGGAGAYVWMTRQAARGDAATVIIPAPAAGAVPAAPVAPPAPAPEPARDLSPVAPPPPEAAPAAPAAPPPAAPEPAARDLSPIAAPRPEAAPAAPTVPSPAALEPAARDLSPIAAPPPEAAPAAQDLSPVAAPPPEAAPAAPGPGAPAATPEPERRTEEQAPRPEEQEQAVAVAPPVMRFVPPVPVVIAARPPDAPLPVPLPVVAQPAPPPMAVAPTPAVPVTRGLPPPAPVPVEVAFAPPAPLPAIPALPDLVPARPDTTLPPVIIAVPAAPPPPPAVAPGRRQAGAQVAAALRVPLPRAPLPELVPGRCTRAQVATRTGSHAGFGRIVFAWRVAADYELRRGEGGAQLRFSGPDCAPPIDGLVPPRNVRAILPDDGGAALWIETIPGARIEHFRMRDGRLVIDVFDAVS